MKKLTFIAALLGLTVLFTNCEEKDDLPKVDFEIIVTGESPNAVVAVINTSDEADSFTWTFSEGADIETSTAVSQQVTVDKVGDFTVTLTALTGDDEKSKSKTVNITGISGINVFENVEMGRYIYRDSIGVYFSCETGEVYTYVPESATYIDFCLDVEGAMSIYSPNRYALDRIDLSSVTWFNDNTDNAFSVADFDAATSDLAFQNFNEADEYKVRMTFDEIPRVIIFKTEEEKWGVIKFKVVDEYKVTLDVKVQKYVDNE
jgi:PKD repeat protein